MLTSHLNSDRLEKSIAIRYLGGILGWSSFWARQAHDNYQIVVKKLFSRVVQLTEDLGVDCIPAIKNACKEIRADTQGIDLVAAALLNGVRTWYKEEQFRRFDPFLDNCKRLVELLR
jgi:hypothetical protein